MEGIGIIRIMETTIYYLGFRVVLGLCQSEHRALSIPAMMPALNWIRGSNLEGFKLKQSGFRV